MNKSQIHYVLQACMLAVEGCDLNYILEEPIPPRLARIGINLCRALESKKLEGTT